MPAGLLLSRAELSTQSETGRAGEPRMGGRLGAQGGVKRPEEREWRRGEDFGDIVHDAWAVGETVHGALGGELPHAEEELPELVLRR